MNPGATVAALRHAFVAEGGELLEGAGVAGVDLGCGGRVEGTTLAGGRRLACETLVGAAGAWSPALVGLPPETLPPVRPVKGQILTLRARPEAAPLAQRLVLTPRCYAVSRPGGQTVVGATSEERGFDVRVTAEGVFRLLEAAREVLPDVDELELVEARAGLRPVTPDNAPVVGRTPEVEGLVWATGHGRNGVLLAPITAEAVAALARGEQIPEPLERFGPGRFGKRARTPTAVAAA